MAGRSDADLLALLRSYRPALLLPLGGPATNNVASALDYGGAHRDGTWKGTPLVVPGLFPGIAPAASSFASASSQFVSVAHAAAFNVNTFTVLAVIRRASTGAYHYIMSRDANTAGNRQFEWSVSSANVLEFSDPQSGGSGARTSAFTIGANESHLVGFSVAGTALSIYNDGRPQSMSALSVNLNTTGTIALSVASGLTTAASTFNGAIQYATFIPSALSNGDWQRIWRCVRHLQLA